LLVINLEPKHSLTEADGSCSALEYAPASTYLFSLFSML